MAVRKIPLESGGYIKFENDEEYYEWLQKQEELRRQQQEEEEEEERVKTILKVGCFVIVLIFLGILGLCSSSNKKKEKRVEETFKTEKREAKTKEQIEQNTYVVSPVQSENASVQLDNEIISEPEIDAFDETVFDEIEVLDEDVFEEEIEPDFSRQKIYQSVEVDEEPKFPGGEHELMEYIADNVVYPQTAIDEGIQGRVIVSFVVEPNGKVTNVEVLRGIGGGCDEEAARVVKSLPNWEPGVRRGKNVRVTIAVPVKFALE